MLATMEPEQEVMGTPGRVRDMIAHFSHMSEIADSQAVTKRNGPGMLPSPGHCDTTDNVMTGLDDGKGSVEPVIKQRTLDNTIHYNNDKIYQSELDHQDKIPSDTCRSENVIMNYRSKLRPVANSVILAEKEATMDNVRQHVKHEDNITSPQTDVIQSPTDVTTPDTLNGSEPSLLSRNGQRSSVTASKRTLVSQDIDPSPQKGDADTRTNSQPILNDSAMPAPATDLSYESLQTTPKTPSYMKISCALSGYNRYNTYTSPKQEARLKVLKLTQNKQNGSYSSLSSQQSDSSADVRSSSNLSIKVKDDDLPSLSITNAETVNEQLNNGGVSSSSDNDTTTSMTSGADHPLTILTNGRTAVLDNELDELTNGGGDKDKNECVNMASVNILPSGNTTSLQEFELQLEDRRKTELRSAVSTPSPSKDGHYYFPVLDREVARIRAKCMQCEADMASNSLSEEVCGKMRAAIGKSNLLIDKKFQQFRGLCERNISQSNDEAFQTTVTDLAGFWDMVSLQISDIDTMFADIEKMRQSGWKVVKFSPVKQQTTLKGGSKKSPRSKETSTSAQSKSAKAEASRARDEARKRLLAAKRAGRQRKASQSDKDEIEIFIAE